MSETRHPKTRRFQLCVDKLETLEDVKKVLDTMMLRIDSDNPSYENVKEFFKLEVVPRGYIKLLEKIGYEGLAKLHFHEIEQQALELLEENEKTFGDS